MTLENKSRNQSSDGDEVDLKRLVGEIIDHRKLIIAITVAFAALGILYAFVATPIYQANVLIQVEQKQGNAILSSLSQVLPGSQPQSAPEIALLQSRMILGKTVDDLNLQAKVEQIYFPVFGRSISKLTGSGQGDLSVSYLKLPKTSDDNPQLELTVVDDSHYKVDMNDKSLNGKVGEKLSNYGIDIIVDSIDAEPGTRFSISYITKLKAIDDLQDGFNVADQGKDTGVLNLTLKGENPDLVSKILNSVSKNYLAQNVARQAAQDAKSLEFLDQQLPKVRSDLDIAEDKLNAYRRKKDSVDLTMEAKSVLDQIVNVDNQLNELTFKEAEISQLYTQEHPTYKALNEKKLTLQEEKTRLNKRVSSMPSTQQEVLRLSRDVESGRAIYLQLLSRQQELRIAKSSAIGNVRIIDEAVTQPKPVAPKKIVVILVSVILGLFTSIGLVLLRIFMRRGIESPEQLEDMGISVYASIPVSETLSKANKKAGTSRKNQTAVLLAVDNPADLAIEAIRSLRTSLHFAMLEAKNNILMISGASPNAGKTFVSSNLAAVMAMGGVKVLYIDADMRKGYIHKLFGSLNEDGLSDVLAGKKNAQDVIQTSKEAGFDYISRGQIPPNPTELLMHSRFKTLLDTVTDTYDLVIIDTPPILAVTDAAVIGNYAGTTLLVARFEENTIKEMTVSLKRFEQSNTLVKGCILNGVVKKASNHYGYGYNYYGYSYDEVNK